MEKLEQIGYHKGALTTLSKEYAELIRLVEITQQLIQMHVKSLKELGVDIEKELKESEKSQKQKLDEKIA